MINKKTILILTVFITIITLTNLSSAQECITTCTDADYDSYTPDSPPNCNENPVACSSCRCGDCDDTLGYGATVNPGMIEICNDPYDNNCNGLNNCNDIECCGNEHCLNPPDNDLDGYTVCDGDCDDTPGYGAIINPGMIEICTDQYDNNCNELYNCEDPECAGQTGPEGKLCCQDASDCTQYDCIIETCENNICVYTEILYETSCDDGIDNDCDGLTDCSDSDCEYDPNCNEIPEYPIGYIIPILITLFATYKLKPHIPL